MVLGHDGYRKLIHEGMYLSSTGEVSGAEVMCEAWCPFHKAAIRINGVNIINHLTQFLECSYLFVSVVMN